VTSRQINFTLVKGAINIFYNAGISPIREHTHTSNKHTITRWRPTEHEQHKV